MSQVDRPDLSTATGGSQSASSRQSASESASESADTAPVAASVASRAAEAVASKTVNFVHDILVQNTERFIRRHGRGLSRHVENTLLRIHHCRSEALGKRVYRCDACNYETTVFNSCGDRHCPNCAGAKRRDWLDKTLRVICPGVTYFQVVFTLPGELSALALGNRTEIYNLLFETAWQSLRTKVEKELGIQAAGLAVLHTWDQRLEHHPHVHLMVPGNGPSLDGTSWVNCRLTKGTKGKPPAPFLVDNKELGREFRDLFLSRLTEAVSRGQIRLEEPGYISDLIDDLEARDWVVFIEGPPRPDCGPDQMVKYLTRYLTGGPISNQRIVGERDGQVHLSYGLGALRDRRPGRAVFRSGRAEAARPRRCRECRRRPHRT